MAFEPAASARIHDAGLLSNPPEQRLVVASLLSMSGGFMDAFTWILLGGVFANSQTGNVVFIGVYAALGEWSNVIYRIFPIVGFFMGAWFATYAKAPLRCLAGEVACLTTMIVALANGVSPTAAIAGLSFGVALQTVNFRQVGSWKYLSITVTGNMLRGIEQLMRGSAPLARRGVLTMLLLCLAFLAGAVLGGLVTPRIHAVGLVVPIALQSCALSICCWHRYGPGQSSVLH